MTTELPLANTRMTSLEASACFAALAHEVRVEIVRLLLRSHPSGLVVGDIQAELDVPASTLSHHLEALKRSGLIAQHRESRNLRCVADTLRLGELTGFLYQECCQGGVRFS